MIVYHVSPKVNLASITNHGVHPRYARSSWKRAWFVDLDRVIWASAHVAEKHNCRVEDQLAFVAGIPLQGMVRGAYKGVYSVVYEVRPFAYITVTNEWLEAIYAHLPTYNPI